MIAYDEQGAPVRLEFEIDLERDVPQYRQIAQQVISAMIGGKLPPGSRLPGRRVLARELGVALGTVDHAYQSLEAEGCVEAHPGGGTFVTDYLAHASLADRQVWLRPHIDRLVAEAALLGLDAATVLRMVRARLRV